MNLRLLLFVLFCPSWLPAQSTEHRPEVPASTVIGLIIQKTGANPFPKTVDVIKEGNPDTPVKGIVTTMFATTEVLKQAVAQNCNLIIAHEPLYYNHPDNTSAFQKDPVYLEKKRYIQEHNLVVWRFHDYAHSIKPDIIQSGFAARMDWGKYVTDKNFSRFNLPETTLKGLLAELKKVFPKNAFQVIGDPELKVSHIGVCTGAAGMGPQLELLRDPGIDVLVAGEAQQWETYEYARDATAQGQKKAVIFLGHVTSEEPGMELCAQWLKTFIKNIPIVFVESGPSYWSF